MKAYMKNHLKTTFFLIALGLFGIHVADAAHPPRLGNPFPASTANAHQMNGLAGALQHLTS